MRLDAYKWEQVVPAPNQPLTKPNEIGLKVRRLGLQDYVPLWHAMRYLAEHPRPGRDDEIWMLSHKPVFTQGQAGRAEHILDAGDIPIVQIDRGGQVTYHGPGQLVGYLLIDVKRRKMGVRELVDLIEEAIVEALATFGISGERRPDAPGVYVNGAKIAALGLRIKNGLSYHGLSLNVDMDKSPFDRIKPCGFEDLKVTQVADLIGKIDAERNLMQEVSSALIAALLTRLGYLA
ncbi:MAG: lipoyl(octanoyl) transferase LipB [Porticoccaceae bacterium]|nr:lipoyl(octanoyl) transferase LipB [Porticoccaceae bacterium]